MIAKHRRAVRPREDRLGHVAPDLAPVDVPRRDNLDVPGPITAQIPMQKPDRLIRPAVRIMRHALHHRTPAVADPHNPYLAPHAVAPTAAMGRVEGVFTRPSNQRTPPP